jgi:hypothetical protein
VKKEANSVGAVNQHEYAVKAVNVSAKTIDLINPWGHKHLNGLTIAKFKKIFFQFQAINTK